MAPNIENKEIIMSLDVSTKTIGICILLNDGSPFGQIIELTHINPKVEKKKKRGIGPVEELFLKRDLFKEFIQKYKDMHIDKVIIEEPLMRSNNIYTVSVLLRFNGMISECIYSTLGIVPEYISSYEARAYSFPELLSIRKYGKDDTPYTKEKIESNIKHNKFVLFGGYPWSIDKKKVIQEKVSEQFPNIPWLYDKNNELKIENFDACDACVAGIGWMNKTRYGDIKPISSKLVHDNKKKSFTYTVSYWDKIEERTTYYD